MRCSRVRKLLSPYIDGELSDRKIEKIKDHVSHCDLCREELKALQNLDALSKDIYTHEPSEAYWVNFLPRLHHKIATASPQSYWKKTWNALRDVVHPSSPWLKTAGAVASVVLIFFIGRAVIQHRGIDTLVTSPGEKRPRETPEYVADAVQDEGKREEVGIEEKNIRTPPKEPAEKGLGSDLERKDEETPPSEIPERETEHVSISPASPKEADEEIKTHVDLGKSSKKMYATAGDQSQGIYDQALRSQRLGENESASAQFQYIIENYPQSPIADDAQFQLNLAQRSITMESQTLEGWQQQRDVWQDFLETYPESELAEAACLRLAESWYHLANLTLTQEDLSKALEVNRDCQKKVMGEEPLQQQIHELEKVLKEQK